MNGYSKMRLVRPTKSRSMDFSDLLSSPRIPKPIADTNPNPASNAHEARHVKADNTHKKISEQEDEDGNGEMFGVILSRNCSVSSSSSHRFRFEKQGTALPSAVKRVFSMRRSSSVCERYCRIHDQSASLASPIEDEGEESMQTGSVKKKHKRGKILKACKRLFGL